MTAQPTSMMTVEAYLAFERASTTKHEYLDGAIHAMSGASVAHNIITGNIFASLHLQMQQCPCTVFPSDMRLGLLAQRTYVYPDVMVVCGELEYADTQQDTLLNPIVIIEVLSPSTENYDRRKKSHYYRMIPSLQEYLLVAQDEPYLEHFVRHSEHQWLFTERTQDTTLIRFSAIDCVLRIEEVYAKVLPRREG